MLCELNFCIRTHCLNYGICYIVCTRRIWCGTGITVKITLYFCLECKNPFIYGGKRWMTWQIGKTFHFPYFNSKPKNFFYKKWKIYFIKTLSPEIIKLWTTTYKKKLELLDHTEENIGNHNHQQSDSNFNKCYLTSSFDWWNDFVIQFEDASALLQNFIFGVFIPFFT